MWIVSTVMKNTVSNPKWADANLICKIYGIGKTTIWRLYKDGKIRTSSLREPGTLRGKRLFEVASVEALLESRATGGNATR